MARAAPHAHHPAGHAAGEGRWTQLTICKPVCAWRLLPCGIRKNADMRQTHASCSAVVSTEQVCTPKPNHAGRAPAAAARVPAPAGSADGGLLARGPGTQVGRLADHGRISQPCTCTVLLCFAVAHHACAALSPPIAGHVLPTCCSSCKRCCKRPAGRPSRPGSRT